MVQDGSRWFIVYSSRLFKGFKMVKDYELNATFAHLSMASSIMN